MEGATFLTVQELAEYLRIGRTAAYELARRPDFPTISVGRVKRIPRDRLEEWVKASAARHQ